MKIPAQKNWVSLFWCLNVLQGCNRVRQYHLDPMSGKGIPLPFQSLEVAATSHACFRIWTLHKHDLSTVLSQQSFSQFDYMIDMLFPGDNLFKSGSSMNDIETRLNKLYTPEPQPCPGWRRSVADCTAHAPGGLGIAGLYGRSFPPIYWVVVKDDEWNAGVWTTIYRYTLSINLQIVKISKRCKNTLFWSTSADVLSAWGWPHCNPQLKAGTM